MALDYTIHTDLEPDTLSALLKRAAKSAGNLWSYCDVSPDLGPFHAEIVAEYGITRGFTSGCWIRLDKVRAVEACDALMAFAATIPGRRLVRLDDALIELVDSPLGSE